MPTCQTCRAYLPTGGGCSRCLRGAPQVTSTQAFAARLRAQSTTPPQTQQTPGRAGRFWGPATGEVRRERDTWTGRAYGTTLVTFAGLTAPLAVGTLTGSATASSVIGTAFGTLAVLLLPVALLIMLGSLGRGGPLAFTGRMVGTTAAVGMGLASRSRRGGPGRILIVEHQQRESRVLVARHLDVPIGSSVTVRGPLVAGYRHAWFIRVHGIDDRALPTRGVLLALASVSIGCVLSIAMLIGGHA